ncbi:MAG TPA: bifunctional DNA-formamidopyrimidine glycosylase/DNA-(apurinic or apyrimidinic site) lyase [Paracoccaceae bacterium]|nr:bifunctional DNA-formamidopyrimidine glycosylase/DNA-(apurinic or apyrimidinic site) lyase [Paracoccaceae bacterium]
MPELPEVETVRRGLEPVLSGRVLARVEQRRPDLRWPLPERFAERLTGRRVDGVGRRSKWLLVGLDDGETWMVHLGMSGRVLVSANSSPLTPLRSGGGDAGGNLGVPAAGAGAAAVAVAVETGVVLGDHVYDAGKNAKHDHVVVTTDRGVTVTYNDARRFGAMDLWPTADLASHPHLAGLGPEPLGNAFHGDALAAALKGRQSPVKAALMDQKTVAGLGNIYVCEALHRAGIHPTRIAATISRPRVERLTTEIRATLIEAIAAGGSSLRDYRHTDGELGYFQHSFRVYDREGEPCPTPGCSGTVRRIVQSGRSTFYCPRCQR